MATMHYHHDCIIIHVASCMHDHELTKLMQMCHSSYNIKDSVVFVFIDQLVAKLHQIMQGVKSGHRKIPFGLFIIAQ